MLALFCFHEAEDGQQCTRPSKCIEFTNKSQTATTSPSLFPHSEGGAQPVQANRAGRGPAGGPPGELDLDATGAVAAAGRRPHRLFLVETQFEEPRQSFAHLSVEVEVRAKKGGALQEVVASRPVGEENAVRCLPYKSGGEAVPVEALGAAVGTVIMEVTHSTGSGFC